MGSAFTPVYPRGSTPIPANIIQQGGRRSPRPNKRTRERHAVSALHKMVLDDVEEVDEEQTVETVPDHVSASSASESSSKASDNSQPPLLDFMGGTCMVASAWFTTCFPCAVVDINDSDDYVVDKLSRESAMNVMYAKNSISSSPTGSSYSRPEFDGKQSKGSEEQDKNVVLVQIPEHMVQHDTPIDCIPSVVVEEDSQDDDDEDDVMDTISLNDDAVSMPVPPTPERSMDSGIVDYGEYPSFQSYRASANNTPVHSPAHSPPKKKKKFGMKLFGRKKKA